MGLTAMRMPSRCETAISYAQSNHLYDRFHRASLFASGNKVRPALLLNPLTEQNMPWQKTSHARVRWEQRRVSRHSHGKLFPAMLLTCTCVGMYKNSILWGDSGISRMTANAKDRWSPHGAAKDDIHWEFMLRAMSPHKGRVDGLICHRGRAGREQDGDPRLRNGTSELTQPCSHAGWMQAARGGRGKLLLLD